MHPPRAAHLLDTIGRKFGPELITLHTAMFDDAGDFSVVEDPATAQWRPPAVQVRSLLDRYTTLCIAVSHMNLAEAFPDDHTISPGGVCIVVSIAGRHCLLNQGRPVARLEADAWARAVFGGWSPRAYYRGPLADSAIRPLTMYYALYLDSDHRPRRQPSTMTMSHELLGEPDPE